MTMDFFVADTIDLSQLKAGMDLHIEITKTGDSDYLVTTIHVKSAEPSSAQSAVVTGTINAINTQSRVVNISREAIPKWDRPAATLDFTVSDAIDISQFTVGADITFTFEIADGNFRILSIQSESQDASMDHSNHGGAHE